MHQKLVKYYIHKYDIEITLKIAFTFCKGLQQVKKLFKYAFNLHTPSVTSTVSNSATSR